jgi:hypothetical protein
MRALSMKWKIYIFPKVFKETFGFLLFFSQDYFGKVKFGHFKNVQNWKIPKSLENLQQL